MPLIPDHESGQFIMNLDSAGVIRTVLCLVDSHTVIQVTLR